MSNDISRRAIKSAKWGYAGGLAKIAIQVGSQAILARLLGPSEYGIFTIGLIIISLSVFLAESGAGAALIQRQEISEELITFAFSVQVVIGFVVMIAIVVASKHIAHFYNEPRAEEILQALSIVVFVTAIGSISSSLLKKHLDFKNLQIGQVCGYFIGYVVIGIPAALYGAGVWALALAWVSQAIFTTVYWYAKTAHSLKISYRATQGRELLRFGSHTILSNIATWAGGNIDKMIVGRAMSASALALYAIPFTFLGTAASQILSTLQPVLFSAASQASHDKQSLRNAYLGLLEAVALILLPIFITIACTPEIVLSGIYGSKWLGATEIMRGAACCMVAYVLGAIGTPVLWALAEVKAEARVQIGATVLIGITTLLLAPLGAPAVAWGVAAIGFIRMVCIGYLISNSLQIGVASLIKAIIPAVIASFCCAYVALFIAGRLHDLGDTALLGTTLLSCGFTLLISVLLMHNTLLSPALRDRIQKLLPTSARNKYEK